ncbi:SDR family oxidoreductase [Metabacillus sp. GX 13764]|uniref:SDR family oxidoreductase n=1 Tax=Metabacillus kandeliae TaxID=2900151 RepID=UPI001E2EF704|nr:SDR family oxidoreductase [Metabacillus kandeliae]MCD7036023.1 SDR family oxidoreductase [Metabacillus kandeliae]
MKVLVVGANGQIGKLLIDKLKNDGKHTPIAMVRKQEQADAYADSGVETVMANLEDSVENLTEAVKGKDAIVFTAGSGGSTGADKTLLVDLDGAVKVMEAGEAAGVKRFVMVSALQANNRENWNEKLKSYYVAKHYADKALQDSSLNYTIVRPGGLLNDPGTGKVSVGEQLERGSVPREDVAAVIAASLEEEKTYKRAFDLVSGDSSVEDAVKSL